MINVPNIDAKTAAKIARDYLIELIGIRPEYLTMEEVEISDDDKYWFITLSYQGQGVPLSAFVRKYKIFKIDSYNGSVISMKIRELIKE